MITNEKREKKRKNLKEATAWMKRSFRAFATRAKNIDNDPIWDYSGKKILLFDYVHECTISGGASFSKWLH